MKTFRYFLLILVLVPQLFAARLPLALHMGKPHLSRTSLPADGQQEAILTILSPGRYSIRAQSSGYVSINIISRLAGPYGWKSTSSKEYGKEIRYDITLDKGEYKVLVKAGKQYKDPMSLSVFAFKELNGSWPAKLQEFKDINTTLGDKEQRSYWIEIQKARHIAIEAAGRNLSDVALWKDGSWLVAANKGTNHAEPKAGKPLHVRQLHCWLEPGVYLFTAYGGPARTWAAGGKETPLHIRYGIPNLATVGRRRFVSSPLGYDRYLVPAKANYLRLELDKARKASIMTESFSSKNPFNSIGKTGFITKKSRVPVAELSTWGRSSGFNLVTVKSEAGKPYVLQHFERQSSLSFTGSGDYWLSTVHAGHAGDFIDASGLVVSTNRYRSRDTRVETGSVVEVSSSQAWVRRFNLLAEASLFIKVREQGTYQVIAEGANIEVRIEPFLLSKPRNYRSPSFRPAGKQWKLGTGYHLLTLRPRKKGDVEVSLMAVGGSSPRRKTPKGSCRFGAISTDKGRRYSVHMGKVPGVNQGFVLRKLPLDLNEALPLYQRPGETVSVSFTVKDPAVLQAETLTGEMLPISVNGAKKKSSVLVDRGTHRVSIQISGKKAVSYSLYMQPKKYLPSTPLPQLNKNVLKQLPPFVQIDEGAPRFFDLGRNENRTFMVKAHNAALFRIETTGLLATEGTVRTRTIPSLAKKAENGVGRNFLVQHYLGKGDYQVTVKTRGRSAGHLGLELRRSPLLEGGELALGIPARVTLATGQAIRYTFTIKEAGSYSLRALGLGRRFPAILADADGWPLDKPGMIMDIDRPFEKGKYTLLLLPEAVTTRRVITLKRERMRFPTKGHGPHNLIFNQTLEHTWKEPVPGQERKPDVWTFNLPAQVNATITLTEKMEGTLYRIGEDKKKTEVLFVPMLKGWKGTLQRGSYRFETVCARKNNHVDYRVGLKVKELVDGQERIIRLPANIPISVGKSGIVELGSLGQVDTRARLLNSKGEIIAKSDDRDDDWNFLVAKRLIPGFYELQVEAVGENRQPTVISMRSLREEVRDTLVLPFAKESNLQSTVHLFPIEGTAKGGVLVVSAQSAETIGCAVEKSAGKDWQVMASKVARRCLLAVPLQEGFEAPWLLRLWSVDRRGNPAKVTVQIVKPEKVKAGELVLKAIPGLSPPAALVKVEADQSAVYTLKTNVPVQISDEELVACRQPEEKTFGVSGKSFWLAAALTDEPKVSVKETKLQNNAAGIRLRLPASGKATGCDISENPNGPTVVSLRSVIGQPAVAALGGNKTAQAIGQRAALTLLPPATKRVALWSADGKNIRAIVRQRSFTKADQVKVQWQGLGGSIEAGGCRELLLPEGKKNLLLAIGQNTVGALLNSKKKVESVHWGDGSELVDKVETESDRVYLVNKGENTERFLLRPIPRKEVNKKLNGLTKRYLPSRGTCRYSFAASEEKDKKSVLHLRGAVKEAVFISNEGKISRGLDIPLAPSGGVLTVKHEAGPIVLWREKEKELGVSLWYPPKATLEEEITPPVARVLSGALAVFTIKATSPAVAHIRTVAPVITLIKRKDKTEFVTVHKDGCDLDLLLTKGDVTIGFRPLRSSELYGPLEVTSSSITALGEGLGPECLLPPGNSRFYSFAVKRKGAIGVGVRSEPDEVSCTLLDSSGRVIEEGVVQMPTVEPGNYYLKLHTQRDGQTVKARPALAGIAPPDTGPPDEVVAQYLKKYSKAGGNQ